MAKKRQTYETTGAVLKAADTKVKSVLMLIEYQCDIEHLQVTDVLESLRDMVAAEIIKVTGSTKSLYDR